MDEPTTGIPARRVRPREWAFREEHAVDRRVLRGFTGTSFWYDIVRDRMVLILSNRVHYGRDNKAFLQLRPQIHDWVVESLQA